MIVKGTKQLGNFKRGINLYVPKKRTVVLRIVISGAGRASSNGEYVWDGVTLEGGKPRYDLVGGAVNEDYIYWVTGGDEVWGISDNDAGITYLSSDLITWDFGPDGVEPLPTSTLSYTP